MTFTQRPCPTTPGQGLRAYHAHLAYLPLLLVLLGGFVGGLLVGQLAVRTRVVRTDRIVRIVERSADGFQRTARGR